MVLFCKIWSLFWIPLLYPILDLLGPQTLFHSRQRKKGNKFGFEISELFPKLFRKSWIFGIRIFGIQNYWNFRDWDIQDSRTSGFFWDFPFFRMLNPSLIQYEYLLLFIDFCLSMCHFWAFEIPKQFLNNETCTFFLLLTLFCNFSCSDSRLLAHAGVFSCQPKV